MTETLSRRRSAVCGLCVACFILALLLSLPLPVAAARPGAPTLAQPELISALNGLQPLPNDAMANETARGVGSGELPAARTPSSVPSVRLWDDFGPISRSGIGNTIITITGIGNEP